MEIAATAAGEFANSALVWTSGPKKRPGQEDIADDVAVWENPAAVRNWPGECAVFIINEAKAEYALPALLRTRIIPWVGLAREHQGGKRHIKDLHVACQKGANRRALV